MSAGFSVAYESSANVPISVGTFRAIKNDILGTAYDLTLVFVPPQRISKLNTIYRDKNRATDILSFPLSETEGEIYICPSETRKEAKKFKRTYPNFLAFLFIHGCVHLKGYDHGSTMEKIEAGIRHKFKI